MSPRRALECPGECKAGASAFPPPEATASCVAPKSQVPAHCPMQLPPSRNGPGQGRSLPWKHAEALQSHGRRDLPPERGSDPDHRGPSRSPSFTQKLCAGGTCRRSFWGLQPRGIADGTPLILFQFYQENAFKTPVHKRRQWAPGSSERGRERPQGSQRSW